MASRSQDMRSFNSGRILRTCNVHRRSMATCGKTAFVDPADCLLYAHRHGRYVRACATARGTTHIAGAVTLGLAYC